MDNYQPIWGGEALEDSPFTEQWLPLTTASPAAQNIATSTHTLSQLLEISTLATMHIGVSDTHLFFIQKAAVDLPMQKSSG
jgi:hypothetical protein